MNIKLNHDELNQIFKKIDVDDNKYVDIHELMNLV